MRRRILAWVVWVVCNHLLYWLTEEKLTGSTGICEIPNGKGRKEGRRNDDDEGAREMEQMKFC